MMRKVRKQFFPKQFLVNHIMRTLPQVEDLIGRHPVLPFCLRLRSKLPQQLRAAVVQALMPKKQQGCLDHHATITLVRARFFVH